MEVPKQLGILGGHPGTRKGEGIELSGFPLAGTGVVTIRGRKAGKIGMTGGAMLARRGGVFSPLRGYCLGA